MIVNPPCTANRKGNIGLVLLLLLGLLVMAGLASWLMLRPAPIEPMLEEGSTGIVREIQGTATDQAPGETGATEQGAIADLGELMFVSEEILRLVDPTLDTETIQASRNSSAVREGESTRRLNVSRTLTGAAVALMEDGKSQGALLVLDEAIRFHEDNGLPAAWKARVWMRLGERLQAKALVESALVDHPESVTLLRIAAEIARLEGQDETSVSFLQRAIALDPEAPGLADELARAVEEARVMSSYLTNATAHFDLRYDPQEMNVVQALPELGAVVEEAWQDVLAATGLRPQQRILIMLLEPTRYRTAAPDWSSGLYDGRVRLVVDDPAHELDSLARTLRHELTHAALFTIGATLPTWIHEGLAQQVEGGSVEYARQSLRQQEELLLNSAELAGDWTRWQEEERVREAYFYSLSMTAWLGEEYGGEVWANLFQNLQGRTYEDAWQLTFGQGFDELHEKHRQSLR